MESTPYRDQRVMGAFWLAAALAAIGAVAPLALSAGAHSRIAGAAIPFGVALVALAVNAVMYYQGRALAATLYLIAGFAIVYGILAMVAVPLRIAIVGTCPAPPLTCPAGYEQPLTSGENSGLGVAAFCGILAIFIGFYGLLVLWRRRGVTAPRHEPALWPAQPPASAAASSPADPPTPTPVPPARAETEAGDEPKELPAPEELKELPPPA